MFNKVLVGFDGSERAQDALALGVSLRAPDGASSCARCITWTPSRQSSTQRSRG